MSLFGLVRQVIAAPRAPLSQLGIIAVAVAAAGAIRWFTDRGAHGVPFVTFVPVVVLAAVFLEWQFAVIAALVSLVTVVGLFGEAARLPVSIQNVVLWGAFIFISTFMIITGHVLRQTILELNAHAQKIRRFNAELQHRTKNTLQIVRALASRAARATDPLEFYNTLAGRLDAMAKANELLGYGDVHSCDVGELVRAAMQPFPGWSVDAAGQSGTISGESGMQLMMALHELGTNAIKYGALSVDSGKVWITWTAERTINLIWEERGGPPVTPPVKTGLGSRILTPNGAFRAVDIDYRREGLVCRLTVDSGMRD